MPITKLKEIILMGAFAITGLGFLLTGKVFSQSDLNSPVKTESIVPNAEIIKDSCREVSDSFDAKSKLTKQGKDEAWEKKFKGKFFKWEIVAIEIKKNLKGPGFIGHFKCSNSKSSGQNLAVLYPDDALSFVVKVRRDQIYKVRGKLVEHSTPQGISAEAVQFNR